MTDQGDGGTRSPEQPQPPAYGTPPPYGQPPGQPPYGQPPYGQPQYGQPAYGQYGYNYPHAAGTNGLAIASLICAFFCSPLGLIFGFVAKSQIRRTGQQGNGLATAGIVVSAVSLVLGVIWFIAVAASTGSTNY